MTQPNLIDDPAYRLFQQRFAGVRRARATETILTVAIALLVFAVSAVWTDFSPLKILEGMPRIGEYFGKLLSPSSQRMAPIRCLYSRSPICSVG